MGNQGNERICPGGHIYYKTSDCPVCPACEKERKAKGDFLYLIPAPARRALERKNIVSLLQLSRFNETDILKLHGIGPGSISKLRKALKETSLSFNKKQ